MKSSILLLALATIAFSSCTTAYKTGQTPDDVYYSPARPQDEYVRVDRDEDRGYRYDEYYYDDRYLRMKVNNRTRWSELNDWYYFGDRYSYSYYNNNIWNNPWNPNTYWNNYYNPYCRNNIITPKYSNYTYYTSVVNRPRTFNLNTYNNNLLTNKNYTSGSITESRTVTKPVSGTVIIYLNSVLQSSGYTVDYLTGIVTFAAAPSNTVLVQADFEFDVPVRFDTDKLSAALDTYGVHSWNDIPIIETRV